MHHKAGIFGGRGVGGIHFYCASAEAEIVRTEVRHTVILRCPIVIFCKNSEAGFRPVAASRRLSRVCFKNDFGDWTRIPQGLKPLVLQSLFGPAEAVPLLQNCLGCPCYRTVWGALVTELFGVPLLQKSLGCPCHKTSWGALVTELFAASLLRKSLACPCGKTVC
jgi:hypothetical protein